MRQRRNRHQISPASLFGNQWPVLPFKRYICVPGQEFVQPDEENFLQLSPPVPLPDIFIPALVTLAATASVVAASVSRQENLSGRTRALTKEFRELADKAEITEIDRERLISLPKQIWAFQKRLRHCVTGHILLYLALAAEAVGFGAIFVKRALQDLARNSLSIENAAIVVAFALLFFGVFFHTLEYTSSHETIDMELQDIQDYDKDVHRDIDSFLNKIRRPKT
jgi:hypothetical protein